MLMCCSLLAWAQNTVTGTVLDESNLEVIGAFFLQEEDGIGDVKESRGLGDVKKSQGQGLRSVWLKNNRE